jgi:hypothetical protein
VKARIYPAPEAISPGKWEIVPTLDHACVDLKKRVMSVPLDDTPQWRNVRAHELAHVAFSPATPTKLPRGVTMHTLQAVEDYRVNTLAQRAGVDFSAGGPEHIIEGAILSTKNQPHGSILLCLAVFPPERLFVRGRVHDQTTVPEIAAFISATIDGAIARMNPRKRGYIQKTALTYPLTVKTARWIDEQCAAFSRQQAGKGKAGKGKDNTQSQSTPVPDGQYFGNMHIERPVLNARGMQSRSLRPTDEGSIFRAPWRVTTDNRVFRRSSVARSASVLVDTSGSMSLSSDDVRAIVKQAPASIVAAYSANPGTNNGPLRILAQGGRITTDDRAYVMPGGNIIDVPALKWLSKQPRPRYWVCDGDVTGLGDTRDRRVNADCDRIVRSAGIIRVDNAEELQARLGRKR